ncbi:MAG: ACT domain-containing protein [Promethearchaeota archaeon]
MVVQISVFLRNKPGELRKVTNLLAKNNIDIRALTVAETADYGILRLIVNKPDECFNILQSNGILVGKTEIMAVKMEDRPGSLNRIADILADAGVNIEYLYAFTVKSEAILLLQITKQHKQAAIKALKENNIKIYSAEEIYNL